MGGSGPATSDLCGGLSPCDAFPEYSHGLTGVPAFCFLPPMVDNHLSHPACSAPFVPGLEGFQLAWCEVQYASLSSPSVPTILSCQHEDDWQDLVQDPGGGEFYVASVRWRRPDIGRTFRLYVVRNGQHFAHRDVIVDPNLTRPADDFLHAIGTGTEPVKVRITDAFGCAFFDTQGGEADNAATCLIAGDQTVEFSFGGGEFSRASFYFPDGNAPFFAEFEISECRSLWFDPDDEGADPGVPLVDVPLGGCMIFLSSDDLAELDFPGTVTLDLFGSNNPFHAAARPNVIWYDDQGIGVLPPSELSAPTWLGVATSDNVGSRLLEWGKDKLRDLAAFFGPQPVYAWPGSGWDFTRLSDAQIAWMGVVRPDPDATGAACATPHPACVDMGFYATEEVVTLTAEVTAPSTSTAGGSLPVPGTRLHAFVREGTGLLACPSTTSPLSANGQQCFEDGVDNTTDPATHWGHFVGITGTDGRLNIELTTAVGLNVVDVSGCAVARVGDGTNEPDPPDEPGLDDGVWGSLGTRCVDRLAGQTADGYDNGAADGDTPYEPARLGSLTGPFGFEHGVDGLPVTFVAHSCGTIDIDGDKDPGEWDCVEPIGFIAPVKGPQPTSDNAWLYTYNDGDALYVGVEVVNNELGNKIFINLVDQFVGGSLVAAADDDLLLIDFGDPTVKKDWYYTQACVNNSASSLCGAPDTVDDLVGFRVEAAALLGGAGSGRVFYEFKRPFGANPAEDLDALPGDTMGLRVQVTQGQGGGKGGFVYPDPQTSTSLYHVFTLK